MKLKEFAERSKSFVTQCGEATKESAEFAAARFKQVTWEPKPVKVKVKNVVASGLTWLANQLRK